MDLVRNSPTRKANENRRQNPRFSIVLEALPQIDSTRSLHTPLRVWRSHALDPKHSKGKPTMVSARKYAASGFIKFQELKDKGPIRSRVAFVQEGQYGKLDATLENGRKLGLNGTSVGALMAELGDDTDTWVDHEVEVYAGVVQYPGSPKDAVLVRPLDGASVDETPSPMPAKQRAPAKKIDDEVPF
jgi:hypothetical protein